MVQSFDEFCGYSPIWDEDLLLNSSYPHFTDCFQDTLLIWVPCAILWLSMPLYIRYLLNKERTPLPLSGLNVSKTFFSLILFFVCGVILLYSGEKATSGRYNTTAFYTGGSINAATFLLVALTVQLERKKGVITSGVLFVFWLLTSLAAIIPFYTKIEEKEYDDRKFQFTLYCVYFALVLLQLVLTSFVEKHQRRGYQTLGKEECPEVKASFPSKLSFEWITKLVVKIYKSGIKDYELWDLHPRDKSETFIPKVQKSWQEELQKYRQADEIPVSNGLRKSHLQETSFIQQSTERTPLINTKSKQKYDGDSKGAKKEEKTKGPSLFKVLVKNFGGQILIGWMCKFLYDLLQFVNPMILNLLIGYVESKGDSNVTVYEWKGYVYAAGLFVVAMTQSVFFHQNFHICMTAGMRMKSALISAVYSKALTMNSEAKKSSTVGEIVNLMSVDCQRIQDITGYLWMLWSAPVQVILAMTLLWNTLGPSVLAGLGIMILLMPINALIAMKQRKFQITQMRLKDQRIKLMNEVLNGIKVLKLYAWEKSFEEKVRDIRDKELSVIRKASYLNAISTFFWTSAPFLVTLATFATYILIDNTNYLDAQKAFVSLSLFNILRFPINLLPMIISYVVQGNVSLGRIGRFLQTDDLDPDNVQHTEIADYALSIERGTFSWGKYDKPTLENINLDISDGKLVAVVGQVGCGKSSLVSAFLGEMEKNEGRVKVKGSVAYVPQQAWIQNATVRENILFGKDVDQNKYEQVIEACALKPDLDILQGGDLTEIGEKGINLSGGQKQRVSLARAVYNNADIYMLDDPLSAVDSHVGKHIFNKVIGSKGLLRNKTRILVTHGVHWLPMVDTIVVMVDGRVSELGSYEELMSHDGAFAQFLKVYLTQEDNDDEDDPEVQQIKSKILERVDSVTSGTDGTGVSGDEDVVGRLRTTPKSGKKKPPLERTISTIDKGAKGEWKEDKDKKKADKLIEAEKAETGNVSWKVYMKYFSAIGALATFVIFALFIVYQGGGIYSSIWLAQWTDDDYLKNPNNVNTTEYQNRNYKYLGIYAALGVGQAIVILIYAIICAITMIRAAGILHNGMLANILKLPMAFFDTTPLGRIVNRFSRDVETIDNNLPANFRMFLMTFFGALSSFIVISYSTPLFLLIILPLAVLYYLVQVS
ncbi:multidrug resistance-associated protein 1-like isoform X2 [Mercenaria mercenaria]|uniref:multidrug resistance-associated protein 1-like isoform X2 n=1 Tax=Mercenaria mercenaria TaxID=6596 RepID=UPI00234EAB6B|nr:multidrug resistance-associated protein 1-like isoform X2 [Mercenaria mercenaria]